jgi:hypothetical protein
MCFWDKGKYQENPLKSRGSAILQIPKNQMIFEKTLFLGRFWEGFGTDLGICDTYYLEVQNEKKELQRAM